MEYLENDSDIELDTGDASQHQQDTNNYMDDQIMDEDFEFEIPKLSRIIFSYGASLDENDWIRPERRNDISTEYFSPSPLNQAYKCMSNKLIESNEALNDYLDEFVFDVKARCRRLASSDQIKDRELQSILNDLAEEETLMTRFTLKTAVETYYIGRVRYGYSNKRLNSRNIYLESSTSYNFGEVVPLDLSLFISGNSENTDSANLFSLFPGKIVILKAQNPTGNFIQVTRFIDLSDIFKAKFSLKCPKALLCENPVSIVCASGPFMSFDKSKEIDLTDTTYMKALGNYVKQYNPDVLYIFGPFFDESQSELIAQWSLKKVVLDNETLPYQWSIDKLFNHQFRALNKEIEGSSSQTKIIFIPSANEFSSINIFPTYAPEIKQTMPIQSFANPSFLNMDGIAIGAISTDVLLHMSRFEISNIHKEAGQATEEKLNRLHRLCSHLLFHRSFYPLLPPDPSVNLECSMYNHLSMPMAPHLLFLPSNLRPFIYNVDETLVINPGKVAKNSIARIMIEPVNDVAAYSGSLAKQTNVEIIKLIYDKN